MGPVWEPQAGTGPAWIFGHRALATDASSLADTVNGGLPPCTHDTVRFQLSQDELAVYKYMEYVLSRNFAWLSESGFHGRDRSRSFQSCESWLSWLRVAAAAPWAMTHERLEDVSASGRHWRAANNTKKITISEALEIFRAGGHAFPDTLKDLLKLLSTEYIPTCPNACTRCENKKSSTDGEC